MYPWIVVCLASLAATVRAEPLVNRDFFDPARHMRVSEVRQGMKGHGLSVFLGTKIERFEVEVVSVLKNFNPKYDVVLIRCSGQNLEVSGPIAGMSGSPIFLRDEQGRDRMIGAFAYGWPMQKVTLAGVQPIEYMLALPQFSAGENGAGGAIKPVPVHSAKPKTTWSLQPWLEQRHLLATTQIRATSDDSLAPLATPIMTSGVTGSVLDQYRELFRQYGMVPLQSGGAGGAAVNDAADIEPGSSICVPMLLGDMELNALGTCTEVLDGHVWGFGHSFNNEGPVALPFGSGFVTGIVARLDRSFKLGGFTKLRGTISTDQVNGIAGKFGDSPTLVPIDIRLIHDDGSPVQSYHFEAVRHPRLTAPIAAFAMSSALSTDRELPQYHTIKSAVELQFDNGRKLSFSSTFVNAQPNELLSQIAIPISAAAENPFESVGVSRISGTIQVTPEAKSAQILTVNMPKTKFGPGETVKAHVTYRPFRGGESSLPIELELPRDLTAGDYQLVVSDSRRYLQDTAATEPFRFTAESADEVFSVLHDFLGVRTDALYVRLVRQADGVAMGRVAMPRLPASRRDVLLGSGRSNTTPFVSSTLKMIPTELVMEGGAEFQITIETDGRVESGAGRTPKAEPGTPVVPVPDETKPRAGKTDSPAGDGGK